MSRSLLLIAVLLAFVALATVGLATPAPPPTMAITTDSTAGPPSTLAALYVRGPDTMSVAGSAATPHPVARIGEHLAAVVEDNITAPATATRTAKVSRSRSPEAVARSTSYVVVGTGTLRSTCFGTNGSTITIGTIATSDTGATTTDRVATGQLICEISTTGTTASSSTTWAATGKLEHDAYRAPVFG